MEQSQARVEAFKLAIELLEQRLNQQGQSDVMRELALVRNLLRAGLGEVRSAYEKAQELAEHQEILALAAQYGIAQGWGANVNIHFQDQWWFWVAQYDHYENGVRMRLILGDTLAGGIQWLERHLAPEIEE